MSKSWWQRGDGEAVIESTIGAAIKVSAQYWMYLFILVYMLLRRGRLRHARSRDNRRREISQSGEREKGLEFFREMSGSFITSDIELVLSYNPKILVYSREYLNKYYSDNTTHICIHTQIYII